MQVCGRVLRMYRLCGGGGVVRGGTKQQMGVVFPHCPPPSFHHHPGHTPAHRAPTWKSSSHLSYDTFFTMKRLLERSRRPDEVLRWICQNPSKVSHSHLAVALQRISQLLPSLAPTTEATTLVGEGGGANDRKRILEHEDFLSLCNAIVRNCDRLDNYSLVSCLYSTASIGLSPDSSLVLVLEAECERRVSQFNQKDLSMVFSSVMRLHLPQHLPQHLSQHPSEPQTEVEQDPEAPAERKAPGQCEAPPLAQHEAPTPGAALMEACLSALERGLERERHPQTLFLLLSYYRGRWKELHSQSQHSTKDTPTAVANPELLLTNRRILRAVEHTLWCVSAVRDQEVALLDEVLAAAASEASNRSLELIFSSRVFLQSRQERFISRLAEELPLKVDSLSPNTMSLIAKYAARHRLRETRLLDTVADYLLKRAEQLDTKVIQRLVFPLSRMSYVPLKAPELFSRLEKVLESKVLTSPLATVNILMSLLQLHMCPSGLLQKVLSPAFIQSLTDSPYLGIVRRYLSLLDSAVDLEFQDYSGPRLDPTHKVQMFDQVLTADEANRKYSYKGFVAEGLRRLIGDENYKQDQILPPGYHTDFLLWMDSSRRFVPVRSVKPCDLPVSTGLVNDFQKFSLEAEPSGEALHVVERTGLHHTTCISPKDQEIQRVVLSVNDKWHYCHNSEVLVGSRAMRDRHLRLLGYTTVQLPYHDLEKLNGIEEVKGYLHQRLTDL